MWHRTQPQSSVTFLGLFAISSSFLSSSTNHVIYTNITSGQRLHQLITAI
uniref:Uncharacterized protein n=1 Tax=Triticum urartu TaxID=4572 RepID=A0A8R7PD63_TRIUA